MKQATVEEEIAEWHEDTEAFARNLSACFGHTEEYYLNMMYSSRPKLLAAHRKPNAFNAWLHHLAQDADDSMNAAELAESRKDEYKQLTAAQKAQFIEDLMQQRDSQQYGLRVGARARNRDFSQICKLVDDLLMGLRARTGIEAFTCIMRNNANYAAKPHWFFTTLACDEYLRGVIRKFEPEKIGVMLEAFAIAGSDYMSHLTTKKEKINFLKAEIRSMIAQGLVEITGDEFAAMSYVHYTRDIQLKYGITVEGWSHYQWCNPSDLSNAFAPLKQLHDDLKSGKCKFTRLTDEQKGIIEKEYETKRQNGELPTCKRRSDAGQKKGKKRARVEDSDDDA
ncbi:hypothetical protein C8Q79DRAFT_1010962 [Trametes meyenii]|nr:hypothetical protein C8Q79DRAFT_1010962 [Trametes meyenii]